MRRHTLLLPALILTSTLGAQTLSDRFKETAKVWEMTLERGDGAGMRRSAETLLQKEGLAVSRSDYNEMQTLKAVNQIASRACVLDGAWEDAVTYLTKASDIATENLTTSGQSFAKLRKEHEQYLSEWRDAIAKQEPRYKELAEQEGLSKERLDLRNQLRDFIEERRNAIAHSEQSLREIDAILARLKDDQDTAAKSLATWKEFLAKEKQDIAAAGTPQKYVADKLEQVKADEARPRFDRLSYARRLAKLDPANTGSAALVRVLLGADETAAPEPEPKPTKKKARKK